MQVIGIDASKIFYVSSQDNGKVQFGSDPRAIQAWVKDLPEGAVVGVEATGRYHRPLLEALSQAGIQSYLLNPKYVSWYRRSYKSSVKNDRYDSIAIARYLERERDVLVPFKMPSKEIQELKDLLSFRETLVEKRTALRQSLSQQTFKLDSKSALDDGFKQMLDEVEKKIREISKSRPLYKKLLTIDGVGPLGAAALTWLFESHDFVSSDQAVAFVGLDVSVRQSGQFVGKSKLTKRGPAFVRLFLFNGANSLRSVKELKPLFDHHAQKKLTPTAVNNIVARKIMRIAYALHNRAEAHFERKNLLPQLT